MSFYSKMSAAELERELLDLNQKYSKFKGMNLSLNMARGKPSPEQLELSADMLKNLEYSQLFRPESKINVGNYGELTGIFEAKKFFADILEVSPDLVIVGGNSSLNLMYNYVAMAMQFGILGNTPWNKLEKVKFLCPVPGYDRHFAICELFNIEMINIDMDESGPKMDRVKKIVESDPAVKGIWCVPKYSNPTGITYSDSVVRQFAALKPAAKDFRILWDNAYVVHHLSDKHDILLNIFDECKKNESEDMVIEFCSTSKITFAGGGISALAGSAANIDDITKIMSKQTIGYDKINQLRHCIFFPSVEKLRNHMSAHAKILKPKFDLVIENLEKQIKPLGIGDWTNPNGGYFISFNSLEGCGKRIYELCKGAGVVLTNIGATYPYGLDPENKNIRIAPTFPSTDELKMAMDVFCLCVKIASVESLILKKKDAE